MIARSHHQTRPSSVQLCPQSFGAAFKPLRESNHRPLDDRGTLFDGVRAYWLEVGHDFGECIDCSEYPNRTEHEPRPNWMCDEIRASDLR